MYTSQLVTLSKKPLTRWLPTMTSTYPTQLMLRGPWTDFARHYDLRNLLICLLRYLLCKLICYTNVFSFIVVNWDKQHSLKQICLLNNYTLWHMHIIIIMNEFEINNVHCLKEETQNIKQICLLNNYTLWYMHIIILMNEFEINNVHCLKEETHNIKQICLLNNNTLWYMHIIIIIKYKANIFFFFYY
jgi:hypothetical protein